MDGLVAPNVQLSFYGVIPKPAAQDSLRDGSISVNLSHRHRWGLRTTIKEAVERCQMWENFNKAQHVLFEIRFSLLGWAHYTQKMVDGNPVMYWKSEGVLHLWDDIPLRLRDTEGQPLLEVTFHEVQ